MKHRWVTVKVPASTSNLGSGFDTLGLALRLHSRVTLSREESGEWELAETTARADRRWLLKAFHDAAGLFFRRARVRRFGARVAVRSEVPPGRGLGASAALRVGVLAGLDAMAGTRLSRSQILQMATELEGHPDNASPAIFGGFTVSGRVGEEIRCSRFAAGAKLKCVTLIPRTGISTDQARKLLPKTYSRADSAHALNRSALIVAALSRGHYDDLRGLFDDRVHQPYRERLIPELSKVIAAGERAGALGGFLSGSGSAIICLATGGFDSIAKAMHQVLPASEMKILALDNRGYQIAGGC